MHRVSTLRARNGWTYLYTGDCSDQVGGKGARVRRRRVHRAFVGILVGARQRGKPYHSSGTQWPRVWLSIHTAHVFGARPTTRRRDERVQRSYRCNGAVCGLWTAWVSSWRCWANSPRCFPRGPGMVAVAQREAGMEPSDSVRVEWRRIRAAWCARGPCGWVPRLHAHVFRIQRLLLVRLQVVLSRHGSKHPAGSSHGRIARDRLCQGRKAEKARLSCGGDVGMRVAQAERDGSRVGAVVSQSRFGGAPGYPKSILWRTNEMYEVVVACGAWGCGSLGLFGFQVSLPLLQHQSSTRRSHYPPWRRRGESAAHRRSIRAFGELGRRWSWSLSVGHPVIRRYTEATEGELPLDISDIYGVIKCDVEAPSHGLYHPVLPYRCRNKLTFPLCRSCAESQAQELCTHAPEERYLRGTWVSEEVKLALRKGYRIRRVWETYHYPQRSCQLFRSYVLKFQQAKEHASGWPTHVTTPEQRAVYVQDYEAQKECAWTQTACTSTRACVPLPSTSWTRYGANSGNRETKCRPSTSPKCRHGSAWRPPHVTTFMPYIPWTKTWSWSCTMWKNVMPFRVAWPSPGCKSSVSISNGWRLRITVNGSIASTWQAFMRLASRSAGHGARVYRTQW